MKPSFSHKALLALTAIAALALGTGCLGGGGSLTNLPDDEATTLSLHIRLGRVDAQAPVQGGVLTKAAANDSNGQITLKNMRLRFISNLRDTVVQDISMDRAPEGPVGGGSSDNGERSVFVNVELAPLRWWNLEIKTFDQNDSVIHYGTVNSIPSKGGQQVNVTVPLLGSRYSMYEARYVLPARIYAAGLPEPERVYQRIFFSRLVLAIDGRVVRDSSSFHPSIVLAGSRFITADTALRGADGLFFFRPNAAPPDTITHVQSYQYVETGRRAFLISAYGYLEGDSVGMEPRLLFQGGATLDIESGAVLEEVPIVLDWKGPGSKTPNDTTPPTPGSPNWTGVGMRITVGRVGSISQRIDVPGGLDL